MKKIIFLTFIITVISNSKAQTTNVDNLKKQLDMNLPDSSRLTMLARLGDYYLESKPDSCLFYVKKLLALSTQIANTDMMCRAYRLWGMCESITGNYAQALQMALKSLELAESTKDSKRIAFAYYALSYIYGEYGDWHKVVTYSRQCKKIAESIRDTTLIARSHGSIGDAYAKLNILDSALIHTQQVYVLSIKGKSRYVGLVLRDLGNIQSKLNNKNLALEYYRMAGDSIQARFPKTRLQSGFYFNFANIYYKYGVTDSAIYYAQRALNIARVVNYLRGIRDAGKLLSVLYDSLHKTDSAFFYQKLFVATNDSLSSSGKTASVENLSFLEQLRQQEKERAELKLKEEHKQNIQYALIALGIITFVTFFLLLSRRVITSIKTIEFLSVVALLIVFEFLNLFLHPFFERITNHSPPLMLLALVFIASLLVPMHRRLEKWAKNKLVEKNRQVRLAAAKKTIEKLSGTPNDLQ